ncbi:MAG: ABC transporter permease [Eubacterium sp.]|nr:ABC transporter permease [Eubacterium sp.]
MIKLLKANFSRLKKELSLWIVAGVTLALTVPKIVDSYKYVKNVKLDDMFFEMIPFIGVLYAVFIALYIGKEYSDKAMRNKLIVGHKRENIYLANFITCFFGSLIIFSMIPLGNCCVGIPLVGGWKGEISTLITYILISVCFTAAIVSVLTLFCMLCSKHAVSAVLAITIAFLLMLIASIIYNALSAPELTSEMIMTPDGIEVGDPMPNPVYVSGTQRTVYEFLMQFLPTGQGILAANREITHPVLNIIYSVGITVIVNLCGIFAFKKKDLK